MDGSSDNIEGNVNVIQPLNHEKFLAFSAPFET